MRQSMTEHLLGGVPLDTRTSIGLDSVREEDVVFDEVGESFEDMAAQEEAESIVELVRKDVKYMLFVKEPQRVDIRKLNQEKLVIMGLDNAEDQ